MNRYMVETPHDAEQCTQIIRQVHSMGYLHYFDWGCEFGEHCGWGVIEAEDEEQALLSVPLLVRDRARAVRVSKFGPEKSEELHQG